MANFKFIFELLSILSLFSYVNLEILHVQPGAHINQHQNKSRESLGIVKGFRSCGGPGNLIQWRYETCKDTEEICHVPADGVTRTCHVDFIPSRNLQSVGLRFTVRSNDGLVNNAIDIGKIATSEPLRKGMRYTISAVGGVSKELKGKDAVFQYILYDVQDDRVEFCAEANLIFV